MRPHIIIMFIVTFSFIFLIGYALSPDRIVQVKDNNGVVAVGVYGKSIHLDPGPAGYKDVFQDPRTGKMVTLGIYGAPLRGILITYRRPSNEREIRIWNTVFQ